MLIHTYVHILLLNAGIVKVVFVANVKNVKNPTPGTFLGIPAVASCLKTSNTGFLWWNRHMLLLFHKDRSMKLAWSGQHMKFMSSNIGTFLAYNVKAYHHKGTVLLLQIEYVGQTLQLIYLVLCMYGD